MSALTSRPRWTVEEFFAWQADQDERYELVDGYPVKLMTGASRRHDLIVANLIREIGVQLRGKPCQPFTADSSIRTTANQIRRPDAGIDCGPPNLDDHQIKAPTVVFEVFSPSTRLSDVVIKADEYMSLATLRHIVFVEPRIARIVHWHRVDATNWKFTVVEGLESVLTLSTVDVTLSLSDIYERITLD